ncbi:Xaa-Pro aminopeptidase [uncultured Clostridium sp.]|uniref:aminopeptidase P family protein n=1 Tax=uncultured Clostridium sp. TaxID=59620 RepID=UPI0008211684|nr:aminopeptidase P family protein [uncultured Clostridium sp.]SCJ94935.1 Xaa-Pro aminopeptidase [uncultured Clostridium sp.]
MKADFFKSNRERLLEKIKDNSIVILFAGNAPKKTADEAYPFTPNRNFYYSTGISEENHIIVMSKINGTTKTTLFIKDIDLDLERWIGKSIRKEEATEISGIEDVKFKSQFESDIHRQLCLKEEINLYLDLERDSISSSASIANEFAKNIVSKYPQVMIKNVFSIFGELRLVKSEEEVDNIKKAISITIEGIEALMKNSKPGIKEYQLESYFDFVCKNNGVKDLAFKTIAAAGKNAATLHYVSNDAELKDGDLIQFDLGAQYNFYNADISRAFPVNGKFTERQKAVYNAVLKVNEEIINDIKPGKTFKDINNKATDLIAEECIKLGLIKDKSEVSKYYFHSIGHSLGLDTHDLETPHRGITFKEGVVYTVEPGIYIEEENIGIRIEDDILVTKDGVINLTSGMIKTVEEIESFMTRYNENVK